MLELTLQTPANINILGRQLYQNPEPPEQERKMWKILKEVRRRQAEWRAYKRRRIQEQMVNPDRLTPNLVRVASGIFVGLKERKCSYGGYVFNLAFPENPNNYPQPIQISPDLPETLWQLALQIETTWPLGIKMLRIDAIRQPDNSIRIIELNPCWVDNIATLQAFYETYRIPLPSQRNPIEAIADLLSQTSNLALIYCERTNGCKKDEIYGLADYLSATGKFEQIVVAPLREVRQDTDGAITIKGVKTPIMYLNGTFLMIDELISQQEAIERIIDAQQRNLLTLAPAQFDQFNLKQSLINLSKQRPDLFVPTVSVEDVLSLNGPIILKPTRAESLMGVKILEGPDLLDASLFEGSYAVQPLTPYTTKGIVCFDTKSKTIFKPDEVFEKINIWVIEDNIVGVLATYSTSPLISDSGFNLPLLWEEK